MTEAAAIKAETEKAVARIYAEAQTANIELYKFLKNLDAVVASVNSSTILVIKTTDPPFNVLKEYADSLDIEGDQTVVKDLSYILSKLNETDRQNLITAVETLIRDAAAPAASPCREGCPMKDRSLFAEVLGTVTKYFLILVLLVLFGIFLSSIRKVDTGNVAVVLRFGRLVGKTEAEQVHEPGLLFAFPYIIDEVVTVPVGSVIEQSVITHYTEDGTDTVNGGYVITGDQNIAVIAASVKYSISDPVTYALRVKDVEAVINACVSNAMQSVAAEMAVDSILTDGKDAYNKAVMEFAAAKLAAIDIGITLNTLELTKVSMPAEVRDVYDEVNSASVQYATILQRAQQYRENIIPMAESDRVARVYQANAAKSTAIATANNDLSEFWGVKSEYESNPEAVRARIYAAKLEAAMKQIGKIRLVSDGETKIILNP